MGAEELDAHIRYRSVNVLGGNDVGVEGVLHAGDFVVNFRGGDEAMCLWGEHRGNRGDAALVGGDGEFDWCGELVQGVGVNERVFNDVC